jgi:hypothetical protein
VQQSVGHVNFTLLLKYPHPGLPEPSDGKHVQPTGQVLPINDDVGGTGGAIGTGGAVNIASIVNINPSKETPYTTSATSII